jgi:AbiV family abortive infection protein
MAVRELPDLSPQQVVRLQDALLANADSLLTSALAVLDLGHVALARSLAILGLEESGKAIAIHERRIAMGYADEGWSFRCDWLDQLWASHEKKLEIVHRFLVEERYSFDSQPPDPGENAARLGTIQAWARRHDRSKQRGFLCRSQQIR